MSSVLLHLAQLAPALLAGQETPAAPRARAEALASVLDGTERALVTLRECERRLASDPRGALPVLLRITEAPLGPEGEQAERLARLQGEVEALLAELEALRATLAVGAPRREPSATPTVPRTEAVGAETALEPPLPPAAPTLSADPLRQGIACYRAGRYAEACQLLAPLDDARAHYWHARALERLEHLDQAILAMERAVARGGEGFERRRAETDLALLRWKRDYQKNLPGAARTAEAGGGGPR